MQCLSCIGMLCGLLHLAQDNGLIDDGHQKEEGEAGGDGGQHGGFVDLGEEGVDEVHVVATDEEQGQEGQEEHQQIERHGEELIRQGHAGGLVAYEQQVLELGGVLFHEEIDAEHQDVEAEEGDDEAYHQHERDDKAQEVGGLLLIELVGIELIAFPVEVGGDALVGGIVHGYHQPCGLGRVGRCILAVGPLHERSRHEHLVELAGEAHDAPFVVALLAVAVDEEVEVYQPQESLADFRQRTALCKAEVIHIYIRARKDDGHLSPTLAVGPVGSGDINKRIGHALQEYLGVEHAGAIDAHLCRHAELIAHEGTHRLDEGLAPQVGYLCGREGTAASGERRGGAHLLAHHEVVGLHEAVLGGEHGQYVTIELYA